MAAQAVEREGVYLDIGENVLTRDVEAYNTQFGVGYKFVDDNGIFDVRGSGLYQKGYGDEGDDYDHGTAFALEGLYKSPLLANAIRVLAGARWQTGKDEYTGVSLDGGGQDSSFAGDIRTNGYTLFGGAQFDLNPSLRLQALVSWGRNKATYDKALIAGPDADFIFNDDPEGDTKTTGLSFRLEYDLTTNWTVTAAAGFYRTSFDNIDADLTPAAAEWVFGDPSATRVWMEGGDDIKYSEYSIGARYQF
ncbi:autotransporter domain-containing protein [Jeongeupia sp. USM3]|uniref:autotransporter domain-containing protein n=1 Tax=Jeongeupia sp. USM3 TaxID=1906741 RepID=UPI00089DED4B|nr:autotransporter domain-containing protein [Jeongeupia sp. USM3]AOY00430.1 hypothetical protein BJP62_08255 [Jeongeupia sp. USM3]